MLESIYIDHMDKPCSHIGDDDRQGVVVKYGSVARVSQVLGSKHCPSCADEVYVVQYSYKRGTVGGA